MKHLLILTLIMLISPFSFAQSTDEIAEECGMRNGEVIPFDPTICPDDKAWSIMSSMLPGIYENTTDVVGLDMATPVGGFDQTLGVANVLRDLYSFMFDVSVWVMIVVLGVYAVDLLSKFLRSGKAMRQQGFSAARLVGGGVVGVGFLMPYQAMYLGQIFIFSLSLAAPGLANMAHSAFLANQQSLFASTQASTFQRAVGDQQDKVRLRHQYQAREFYTYLAYMEMCRRLTASELLTEYLTEGEEVPGQWDCLYGQHKKLSSQSDIPSFIFPKGASNTTLLNNSGQRVSVLTDVGFEWALNDYEQCQYLATSVTSYSCGGIEFSGADWALSPYSNVLSPDTLVSVLDALHSAIRASSEPSQINQIVRQGWQRIYNELLDTAMDNANLSNVNNAVVSISDANDVLKNQQDLIAMDKIYRSKNQDILKQFAAMYYRTAMNALYIGHTISDGNGFFVNTELPQLEAHFDLITPLVNDLESIYCIDARKARGESEAALRAWQNDGLVNSKAHFRCLSKSDLTVMGAPKQNDLSAEAYNQAIIDEQKRLEKSYKTRLLSISNDLANKRLAIESAYIESVRAFEEPNIAKTLRQEGFLSIAHYAFMMNQMYEDTRDGVRYVVSHYELKPNQVTEYGVSDTVLEMMSDGSMDYVISYVVEMMDKAQGTLAGDPILLPMRFVNSTAKAAAAGTGIREGSFDEMTRSLSFILGGGFKDQFTQFGLSEEKITDDDVKEACMQDVAKCPFTIKDPFIALNLLGHDMVNAGSQMMISAIAAGLVNKVVASKRKKRAGETTRKGISRRTAAKATALAGAATGGYMAIDAALSEQMSQGVQSALGLGGTAVGTMLVAGAVGIIMPELAGELIGIIFFISLMVTILGALLAYVMPLIPLIFVYYNFVAWLCIVIMASFAIFLFAIYLFRANEQAQMLNKTMMNYGVQILFRTVFQYLALIFSWYLFFATTYFIANTFQIALPEFTDAGLASLVSGLMAWLMIGFVFFFGVMMSFSIVEEFTSEMFQKLGLDYKDNKDKMSEILKAILFDQAESAGEGMKDKLAKTGKNGGQEDAMNKYKQAVARLQAMGK